MAFQRTGAGFAGTAAGQGRAAARSDMSGCAKSPFLCRCTITSCRTARATGRRGAGIRGLAGTSGKTRQWTRTRSCSPLGLTRLALQSSESISLKSRATGSACFCLPCELIRFATPRRGEGLPARPSCPLARSGHLSALQLAPFPRLLRLRTELLTPRTVGKSLCPDSPAVRLEDAAQRSPAVRLVAPHLPASTEAERLSAPEPAALFWSTVRAQPP